jgi:hypothetical protein
VDTPRRPGGSIDARSGPMTRWHPAGLRTGEGPREHREHVGFEGCSTRLIARRWNDHDASRAIRAMPVAIMLDRNPACLIVPAQARVPMAGNPGGGASA